MSTALKTTDIDTLYADGSIRYAQSFLRPGAWHDVYGPHALAAAAACIDRMIEVCQREPALAARRGRTEAGLRRLRATLRPPARA